jgi:nucleotide-binding universal stress UspA family protein
MPRRRPPNALAPPVQLHVRTTEREEDAMRILCPTDFSGRSEAAARIGAELARRTRGSVELVHVVPPAATDRQALAADAARLDLEVRESAHARLGQLARKIGEADIAITAHLMEGDVEWSLLARARATGADLIVMGAHARPALERFLLGSVAERTVRVADRPVLIVPPGVDALPERLELLVALDGRAASEGTLGFVRGLRADFACDVTFLRLYWPVEEYRRLGLLGPRELFAPDRDVVADLERTQRARVGELPGAGAVVHAVEPAWGDPASSLLDAAREHGANLLVMGAESRHGLARAAHPPVAERVARHAAGIPVVFVPAPPAAAAGAAREVPRFHTVLAATDLSAAGNRAVLVAYALVAPHGGVVELCTIHERPLPVPAFAYDSPEGKLSAGERRKLEAELRALVPPEAARLGITTHFSIVDGGKPAEAIVQAAQRLATDAIVVGSRGKGGLGAMLGSVSQAVVRASPRPVLVVP